MLIRIAKTIIIVTVHLILHFILILFKDEYIVGWVNNFPWLVCMIASAIFSLCDFKYTSLFILAGTALGQLFGFLFGEALGILLNNNDPCSTNDGWLIYILVVFISFLSGFVIDLITYNRKKNKTSTI